MDQVVVDRLYQLFDHICAEAENEASTVVSSGEDIDRLERLVRISSQAAANVRYHANG